MSTALITEQLKHLPGSPGVYLFKDAGGTVLYVGKAVSLKHRVRSYFADPGRLSPKIERMLSRINDIEFFVTGSEQEALILELNLIKRHRPRYNVRLKDDKSFPYLKINLNEEYPRIYVTRRLEDDGARYFGPFASARSVRQTLKVLKGIFPFRSCSRTITGKDPRACLDYYIHRCLAPCIGVVGKEEYGEMIKQVVLFLEGRLEKVIKKLEMQMKEAAEALDFERATLLRDQVKAISKVIEGQRIAAAVKGEQDVIAFAQDKDQAYVQVFFIRNNRLIGRESFVLQGTSAEEPKQIMTDFVKQFYSSSPYVPPSVILQHSVEDMALIETWLGSRRGGKVTLQVPSRGNRKKLVSIVAENAEQGLRQLKIREQTPPALDKALSEIENVLSLSHPPVRIEGYDISNIQGRDAVGSMVVFDEGKPKPSHYRRFRIKTVAGADDYAMLREVLSRRFKRAGRSDTSAPEGWAILPDLVLIDGGKGQLNAAVEVMREAGAGAIPVASLSKENEEVFVPGKTEAIILPKSSPGLQLLQRLRDEAHRFALGYHHKVHKKEGLTSALDSVPGIGAKRKKALLKQFGSVRGIREASEEALRATKGVTPGLAKKLKEYL
ncbi:MAG: excinuclease ABC subunit UvrC [Chloroflexota bacterium]